MSTDNSKYVQNDVGSDIMRWTGNFLLKAALRLLGIVSITESSRRDSVQPHLVASSE